MRKQQDTMQHTENSILAIKAQLEAKINEVRDMTVDLRTRLESDKEDKRNLEKQLTLRFSFCSFYPNVNMGIKSKRFD